MPQLKQQVLMFVPFDPRCHFAAQVKVLWHNPRGLKFCPSGRFCDSSPSAKAVFAFKNGLTVL
jgi:hypothetical protein